MAYTVQDQYSYKIRRLRVVCIGAGLTGIAAIYKLQTKHADLEIDFQIYEKNHDVGGTWLENRYPGCACDVPAHSVRFFPAKSDHSIHIRGKKSPIGADSTRKETRSSRITKVWPTNGELRNLPDLMPRSQRQCGIRSSIVMTWKLRMSRQVKR
jgi:cation diffusion facilitator CzcD-associated flavoprotein CzcO